MNNILLGILGYILFQLFLGVVVSKKIRSEADFLLAGRKLGFMLATFSIFATWFGAESCVGTAGAAYADGLAGVTADPFGYAICLLLMGLVFAVPLWKMKLTTIADFFRQRFSVAAERITALLMVPTSLLWAAAQIRAFGQVLAASSQIELATAITIAAVVVICYTALGGLLADAITDIVQGIVLIAGLIIMMISVIGEIGGISAVVTSVAPSKLSFIPANIESGPLSFFTIAEAWAIPICGSIVAQEVISRVIASRSPNIARGSALMAGWLYFCIGIIPLSLGLVGFTLLPNLADPEHILPLMAQQYLSRFFYILFAGALVSAILSTVDSALLAASALFSHNLIFSLQPQIKENLRLKIVRSLVIVMGVLAYVLALHAEGIYRLVKDASSFGSSGIFVVLIFGLFSRFGNAKSAIAALISGAAVWIVCHYFFDFKWSYLLSLSLSLSSYLMIAMAERLATKFTLRLQDT